MKLLEIYESVLKFAGFSTDDKGYISNNLAGQKQPTVINDLQLILPTQENLRNFNPKNHIVFHPCVENILRSESEVFTKFKQSVNIRLNYTIGVIMQSLLNLIASPALHHKLNPDQLRIMMMVKDVDDTTVSNYVKNVLLPGVQGRADGVFVHIYLKRGGFLNNRKYPRVGITTFPFYSDLVRYPDSDKQSKIKYDKLRVKDREALKQLFEFMIPEVDKEECYNAASDHKLCPYFDALLQTAALVASQLNDLLDLYGEFIEDAEKLKFDSEWIELFPQLTNLDHEIRQIPVQAGNEGAVRPEEEREAEKPKAAPVPSAPRQATTGYIAPAPVQQEVKHSKRGLDFQSFMNNARQSVQQPVPQQPMYQQPMQQIPQQMYPPQMMQQPMGMNPLQAGYTGMPNMPVDLNNVPMNTVVNTVNGPMIMTPGGLVPFQQSPQPMYPQQNFGMPMSNMGGYYGRGV